MPERDAEEKESLEVWKDECASPKSLGNRCVQIHVLYFIPDYAYTSAVRVYAQH